MISEETQRLIQENFNDLPEVIQDSVLHSNWQDKIRRIVQNHKLHIDQGAALESLVFVTMLGIESPDDFVANAREGVRLREQEAQEISLEVEREIFHDIRQKLIEITESHDTIDEVERVTNELTKVDDDIAQGARNAILEGVSMHSKASRVSTPPIKKETAPTKRVITLAKMPSQIQIDQTKKGEVMAPTPTPTIITLSKPPIKSTTVLGPVMEAVTKPTPQSTPSINETPSEERAVEELVVTSSPTAPTETTSAPLDTIASLRLNSAVATARESLEVPVPTDPPAKLDRAKYGSTDPYREPVA
jgi:hypothetical protein